MSSEKQKEYINVLNVFASLCVVILHCNGCFWEGPGQGRSWYTANLLETLCYWAVPVFFMVPGVTLLDYRGRMNTKTFIKKRINKAVIPFVAWSVIALAWRMLVPWRNETIALNLAEIVSGVINADYNGVYWFFPPLFAVYASIPVLSAPDHRKELMSYIAMIGILFICAPMLCRFLGVRWNGALLPPVVGGYIVFLALGWSLDSIELTSRCRASVYILGCLGTLVHLVGTHVLSVRGG